MGILSKCWTIAFTWLVVLETVTGFLPSEPSFYRDSSLFSYNNDNPEENAARLKRQAEELREQIRNMENALGENRPRNYDIPKQPTAVVDDNSQGMSLKNKQVLVVGANGRLGSMVCRYLLRNHPQTKVVACVHYIGEDSPTARGYARLSYEVGAEDGVGSIGPAWSSDDRTATFEYADYMKDYNLQNLRLVECELLDPVQCNTITEDIDAVIWCATDFNGNKPRAISGLNLAFLFRAVADPTKGRVEIEGLRNLLNGLNLAKQDKERRGQASSKSDPISFVHVSTAPDALADFETPFGTFHGLKREGEDIVAREFGGLSHTILQMTKFDDNFVEEDLNIEKQEVAGSERTTVEQLSRKRINRRDAARAAVDALTDETLVRKTVQVWTADR